MGKNIRCAALIVCCCLLLCGCEARLLLLWGACLPDDSFLRAEKDDFPRGKTL